MGKAFIQESTLTDIADAIRAKNGSQTQYLPSEMAAAIAAIPTGGQTQYDVLCFTAEQANSTVQLRTPKFLGPLSFQYSSDNNSWHDWSFTLNEGYYKSDTLTLPNVGSKVYLRGNNATLGGLESLGNTSMAQGSNFILSGKIAASGNIQSLLTYDGSSKIAPEYCYYLIFDHCYALTTAPKLSATTIGTNCYYGMFNSCTSLTTAPVLPAMEVPLGAYYNMFYGCTSLVVAPELPATIIGANCYYGMFINCTSLTTAPELPAINLSSSCYNQMFSGCSSLESAPSCLPAKDLTSSCYQYMFQNCTSLVIAPEIMAEELTSSSANCFFSMFSGCVNLNKITIHCKNWNTSHTGNWVQNVAATGTFKAPYGVSIPTGTNGVPSGWTTYMMPSISYNYNTNYLTIGTDDANIQIYYTLDGTEPTTLSTQYTAPFYVELPEYATMVRALCISPDYNDEIRFYIENLFYIEAATAATIKYNGSDWQYSTDGSSWTNYSSNSNLNISAGSKCFFRKHRNLGWGPSYIGSTYRFQVTSGTINVGGCLSFMSHGESKNGIYEIGYDGRYNTSGGGCYMFYQCGALLDASKLIINTHGIGAGVHKAMFYQCTALVSPPKLPVTETLYSECYYDMFYGCTSLTSAPELPATSFGGDYVYYRMFYQCSSLTTAPALHATTLSQYCYAYMFHSCTSLTTAPELPAMILVPNCYYAMFSGCSNLNSVTVRATTWNGSSCTNIWLQGVSATGDFYNLGGATIPSGTNGIPSGWTEHTSL